MLSTQYVGIDLHRHRSVIVRRSHEGEALGCVRISNEDLEAFSRELALAGEAPEVVLEATYGWVRHEAPHDRVGGRAPPPACRSRPLKLEAA
jgi:hypothetical protein